MAFLFRSCALTLLLAALLHGSDARAIEYDREIDVQNEDEIIELQENGELDEEQAETLIELLQNGVDINEADREDLYELPNLTYGDVDALLEYRKLAGRIEDPEQLIAAGVFEEETLRKLLPFIVVNPDQRRVDLKGSAKLRSMVGTSDDRLPATAVTLRAKGLQGIRAGALLMTTRYRLGDVTYDPEAGGLVASPADYTLRLPKFYAQWNMKDFSILAGTYTLGFGEKLTLSNTNRRRPNGFFSDDTVQYPAEAGGRKLCYRDEAFTDPVNCSVAPNPAVVRSRDFRWTDRFRGVAASAKDLRLGTTGASIDLHGFGSFQTRSVYQYSLYDRSQCEDPRDPDCASLPVYERTSDPNVVGRRLAFETLPDVYDELFGGAHAVVTLPSRLRIGLLGWGASPQWRVAGVNLDLSETVRVPFGGPYGAAGTYASYGLGPLTVSAEVTRTFDSSINNGGGFGVLQRTVLSAKKRELELTLRYYDKRFDNPYSSGPSGIDQLEGQRARNEAGFRVKYLDRAFDDWQLRGIGNFWVLPEEVDAANAAGKANLDLSGRAVFRRYRLFQPEVWARYYKSNLASGRGLPTNEDPEGEEDPLDELLLCSAISSSFQEISRCAGETVNAGAQLTVTPTRWAQVRAKYTHRWGDDGPADRQWLQNRNVSLEGLVKPLEGLRLRARSRLLDEDLLDIFAAEGATARGETSLWNTLDVSYWFAAKKLWGRVRYDNYLYLDARASTAAIRTNPYNAFRIELEGRY